MLLCLSLDPPSERLCPCESATMPSPGLRACLWGRAGRWGSAQSLVDTGSVRIRPRWKDAGHGGRTIAGVCARIGQRILALTDAIWHNDNLGLRIRRSLTAYDH